MPLRKVTKAHCQEMLYCDLAKLSFYKMFFAKIQSLAILLKPPDY